MDGTEKENKYRERDWAWPRDLADACPAFQKASSPRRKQQRRIRTRLVDFLKSLFDLRHSQLQQHLHKLLPRHLPNLSPSFPFRTVPRETSEEFNSDFSTISSTWIDSSTVSNPNTFFSSGERLSSNNDAALRALWFSRRGTTQREFPCGSSSITSSQEGITELRALL